MQPPQGLPADIKAFVDGIRELPDFPSRLAKFSKIVYDKGHKQAGHALAQWALELAPTSPQVRVYTHWTVREAVPTWHFPLVHDTQRNDLYTSALNHFVTPAMHVLEIGTGTGILAMLAARAGAGHVSTCETVEVIAQTAQDIITRNGFAERITVIPKPSTALVVGKDLPERADLLVSEIVDNGLLGEHVLPVMAHAREHLLKPNAVILPGVIGARGCVIGGDPWQKRYRLGTIAGFDLSPFNRFAPVTVQAPSGYSPETAYSDPVELFRFDFYRHDCFASAAKHLAVPIRRDGIADGFLQWIWLSFHDDLTFENMPPTPSVWSPLIHTFHEPVAVRAGQTLHLMIAHDCERLYVEAQGVD